MDASIAGNNRLLIRRFQAQYLVSRDHPAPERVKSRLDETVTRDLAQTLTAALAPWFANSASGLWLIRNLNVELDVNIAWERDRLAKAVASGIARSLAVSVQGGSDGENIFWFPNRAAYLARFLVDVAENCAWSKWYYESFKGLRLLPMSAILRTAVCEQPDTGREALQQLSAYEMLMVLGALTRQDARKIFDRFAEQATAGEQLRCFQAVWDSMQRGPLEGGDEWRDALKLYLGATRDRSDVGGIPLKTAEVGEALLGRHSEQARDEAPAPELRHTRFGGIFLLLPLLDEFPLGDATRGWPDTVEVPAVALVRFLLLVKCCGRPRALRVFYDPLVRDVAAIPPLLTPSLLSDWQARLSPTNLQRFRETWTNWHFERGAVQDRIWVLARIPTPGRPVAVLMDGARGVWLFAGGYQPLRPEQVVEALRVPLGQCEKDRPVILSDPVFVEALHSAFPDQQVLSLADHTASKMAEEDQQLSDILARVDKLPEDFSYLTLPKSLRLTRSFDKLLSVAAQNLLRGLAWRLPGFAGSNLPYLYSNFLDFAGSVEDEPARRVVRLGRPPLHLILNMTGMARKSYRVSWLDERPFALFPEG